MIDDGWSNRVRLFYAKKRIVEIKIRFNKNDLKY